MNNFKLASQVNMIFSFVTILGSIVFLFVLNLSFTKGYENQNIVYLENFYNKVKNRYEENPSYFDFEYEVAYNDYIILNTLGYIDTYTNTNVGQKNILDVYDLVMDEYFYQDFEGKTLPIKYQKYNNISFMGEVIRIDGNVKYVIIVLSDTDKYIKDMTGDIPFYTTLAFLNILVLGNVIIWLWSTNTVTKLKDLKNAIDAMVKDDYKNEIKVAGAQEINELSLAIDKMRQEIKKNEETKKDMIQNLGHDLKTPIAVIKSYAEAILDGIEDKEAANLIIKQADILNNKVKQIIDYSKIGYMKLDENLEEVSMKEVIQQVVDHYKYLTHAQIIVDVESDWKHLMVRENFYIVVSNIIDNAIRYVETKIVIQLKNKKLTIFNDGEHIETEILHSLFKPYEKGSKGQFGLGLAIVKETLDHFGLRVTAQNHHNGVLFTIEPQ